MRQFHSPAGRGLLTALVVAGSACVGLTPAHAALGEGAASIEADRAQLGATMVSTTYAAYTLYTLTQVNGAVVHEFADGSGQVFAITWRGPGRPDLRQLLAGYFDTLQSDNATPALHHHRTPLTVDRLNVVVRSGGHPGAFRGMAVLPQKTPAGFSSKDLQQD